MIKPEPMTIQAAIEMAAYPPETIREAYDRGFADGVKFRKPTEEEIRTFAGTRTANEAWEAGYQAAMNDCGCGARDE